MALTKTNGSITQVAATGNSTTVDVSDAYAATISIKHVNGTGTITAGAQVQPEISHDGGTAWFRDGGAFVFGTTASATEFRTYIPPTDGIAAKSVRFAYTAPTGSTGHTLDASHTKVTAL